MLKWLTLFLVLFSNVACAETHYISDDPGGLVLSYVFKYSLWKTKHDRVVIQGECASACTLAVGFFDGEELCATKNAELAFHSAFLIYQDGTTKYSSVATNLLWFFYSQNDRAVRILTKHGWTGPSPHRKLIRIDALEIVRPCSQGDLDGQRLDEGRGEAQP